MVLGTHIYHQILMDNCTTHIFYHSRDALAKQIVRVSSATQKTQENQRLSAPYGIMKVQGKPWETRKKLALK